MLQPAQVPISVLFSPNHLVGECPVSVHEFDPTYIALVFLEPPREGICHDTVFSGSICFIVDTQHLNLKMIAISNKNIDRYGSKLASKNDLLK